MRNYLSLSLGKPEPTLRWDTPFGSNNIYDIPLYFVMYYALSTKCVKEY